MLGKIIIQALWGIRPGKIVFEAPVFIVPEFSWGRIPGRDTGCFSVMGYAVHDRVGAILFRPPEIERKNNVGCHSFKNLHVICT